MIDIYDEEGYIKDVLSNGISIKWRRDAALLTRYYKMQGKKPKEIKSIILEKLKNESNDPNNQLFYDHNKYFNQLNSVISKAYSDQSQLRTIKKLDVPVEIVEWFVHLDETFEVTESMVDEAKKIRPRAKPKMDENKIKILWTLFIWTEVQKAYGNQKPYMHYLKSNIKRFKEDADLTGNFNFRDERNLLVDWGFIEFNQLQGIKVVFMDKWNVFRKYDLECGLDDVEVIDMNDADSLNKENILKSYITISTGDPPFGDLYNCGLWLEKYKYGTFKCKECGKDFPLNYKPLRNKKNNDKGNTGSNNKSTHNNKVGRPRELCRECFEKIYGKHKLKDALNVDMDGVDVKLEKGQRFCVDCGDVFEVENENDFKRIRCKDCQDVRNDELNRLRVMKCRQKKKEREEMEEEMEMGEEIGDMEM